MEVIALTLNIACIQMDISFGNPEENYKTAKRMIKEAMEGKPDLILLPELWTTGYDLGNLKNTADQNAMRTIEFLQKEALKHNVNFAGGSVANQTEHGIENTLLIVNRKGELVHKYSKLHLFKLMDEHLFLIPGQNKGIFELEGGLFGGLICYDIRFPEWVRSHTSRGAEALIVVAEWPLQRLAHWKSLLIARAIENQCFVIACNRAGADPNNTFAGHSMIIDPWGEIISEAEEGQEILFGEVDLNKTKEVRKLIPIFEDRKPEHYN